MVEAGIECLEIVGECGEIGGGDVDLKTVAVHGVAFVVGGELGERVGGFEAEADAVGELGAVVGLECCRSKGAVAGNFYVHIFE